MKLSSAGSTVRKFSTRSSLKRPFYQRRGVQTATSVLLFTGGATGVLLSNPPEPASPLQDDNIKGPVDLLSAEHLRNSTAHLHHLSALDLLRSWLTYTLCTSSTLVSAGPSVVKTLEQLRDNVPLVGPLTWYIFCGFMKQTMFPAFTGGESERDFNPLTERLLQKNISTMLSYTAESDEAAAPGEGPDKHIFMDHFKLYQGNIIASAKLFSPDPTPDLKPTLSGVRFNGLARDPTILARASLALRDDPHCVGFPKSSPHLSSTDYEALDDLYQACRKLERLARENGIRMDWASDIWPFQPAIDRLNLMLRDEFDKIDNPYGSSVPTVYNTYQCYLTSTPERLRTDMEHAQQHGTTFGAKLVRGAYFEAERKRAAEAGLVSPCHPTKEATDACYDECVRLMSDALLLEMQANPYGPPKMGLAICTNNVLSTRKAVEYFVEKGLMRPQGDKIVVDERLRGRLIFGQLYGMSDALSQTLASLFIRPEDAPKDTPALPLVLKYAPWGPVGICLPYLMRRALENKSVLEGGSNAGGAVAESRAARKEILRRLRISA